MYSYYSLELDQRLRVRDCPPVLTGTGRADILLRSRRRRAARHPRRCSLCPSLFPGNYNVYSTIV